MRIRRGMGFIAAGLVFGAAAAHGLLPASAAEGGLGSFDLKAGARGFQFYNADATGGRTAEGEVPEASASLATGPVGLALSSVAWPGALVGNAGSLILVAQPDAPEEVSNLNYPVRAEARTGQTPDTTENNSVPGASMRSTARSDFVEALAGVQGATGDPGQFGRTTAHSTTSLVDGKGVAKAESVVRDLSLGDGAVKIESITSTAEAVTDGAKGDGTARTVVTGAEIGGQAATIDENGVHFGDAGQPANAIVNQIAQQALSEAGIEIFVSAPTKERDAAGATVTAGSVVFTWTTPNGPNVLVVGGATAAANGGPGLDALVSDFSDTAGALGAGALGDVGGGAVGDAGLDLGSGGAPVDLGTDALGASDAGAPASGPGSDEVALDAQPAVELGGHRLKTGDVVLALVAAALLAVGMRRLTATMATPPAASTCPLVEQP